MEQELSKVLTNLKEELATVQNNLIDTANDLNKSTDTNGTVLTAEIRHKFKYRDKYKLNVTFKFFVDEDEETKNKMYISRAIVIVFLTNKRTNKYDRKAIEVTYKSVKFLYTVAIGIIAEMLLD